MPVEVRPKKLSVDLGSYLDDSEGDRRVEAPGTWAHLGWVGKRAGRNASEVREGPEMINVDVEPPA